MPADVQLVGAAAPSRHKADAASAKASAGDIAAAMRAVAGVAVSRQDVSRPAGHPMYAWTLHGMRPGFSMLLCKQTINQCRALDRASAVRFVQSSLTYLRYSQCLSTHQVCH